MDVCNSADGVCAQLRGRGVCSSVRPLEDVHAWAQPMVFTYHIVADSVLVWCGGWWSMHQQRLPVLCLALVVLA